MLPKINLINNYYSRIQISDQIFTIRYKYVPCMSTFYKSSNLICIWLGRDENPLSVTVYKIYDTCQM